MIFTCRLFFFFPPVDLQVLADMIPEIASKFELPDLKYVLEFFSMRYGSKDSLTDKKLADDVKFVANKLLDIRGFKE